MPEFKVDVMICVSAYVTADSPDVARTIFEAEYGERQVYDLANHCSETNIGPVNKQVYVNDQISLSPVATSYGFIGGTIENMDGDEPEPDCEKAARAKGWTRGGDGDGHIFNTAHYDSWKEAVSWAGEEGPNNKGPIYDSWEACCEAEGIEAQDA